MDLPGPPRLFILGSVLLAGLSATGGYFLGVHSEGLPPSPSPSPTISPSPTDPSTSSSPAAALLFPTRLPSPAVQGTTTALPFGPTPQSWTTSTPPASLTPASASRASTEARVSFVGLPSRVRSRQSFEVRWRVDAPGGAIIERTTLETRTSAATSGSGGSASSSSVSKNTFGGVPAPHVFSATLALSGSARDVTLSVTATVGGREISAGPTSIAID